MEANSILMMENTLTQDAARRRVGLGHPMAETLSLPVSGAGPECGMLCGGPQLQVLEAQGIPV